MLDKLIVPNESNLKIGLLGGSFDPPHMGHVKLCEKAFKLFKFHQIWILPTIQNPFKLPTKYNLSDRIKKLQSLFKNKKVIIVNPLIFTNSIYSYDLVYKITEKHPYTEFYFLAGFDLLVSMHKWKNFKRLIKLIKFIFFQRNLNKYLALNSPAIYLFKNHPQKKFFLIHDFYNGQSSKQINQGRSYVQNL